MWLFNKKDKEHTKETKVSKTAKLSYIQTMGSPQWSSRNYKTYSTEGYILNPVVNRCIQLIAQNCSCLDLVFYEGGERVDNHEAKLLLERPNTEYGGLSFFERAYSFLMISGNSFIECVTLDSQIKELWCLEPDRMSISFNRNGYPGKYTYTLGGRKTDFIMPIGQIDQKPIMHFMFFNPLNAYDGLSPIASAFKSIEIYNSAVEYTKALLDNQARPCGALIYKNKEDEKMSDAQYARLSQDIKDNYQGSVNAGKPMLLEGGLEWQQISLSPKDTELKSTKDDASRSIATALGIPPLMLGIQGDNTYANVSEANRAFYRETIIPLGKKFINALSNFLAPSFGDGFKITIDTSSIEALSEERKSLYEMLSKSEILTTNEKRKLIGYSDYDNSTERDLEEDPAKSILVSSSKVPIEEVGLSLGGNSTGDLNE